MKNTIIAVIAVAIAATTFTGTTMGGWKVNVEIDKFTDEKTAVVYNWTNDNRLSVECQEDGEFYIFFHSEKFIGYSSVGRNDSDVRVRFDSNEMSTTDWKAISDNHTVYINVDSRKAPFLKAMKSGSKVLMSALAYDYQWSKPVIFSLSGFTAALNKGCPGTVKKLAADEQAAREMEIYTRQAVAKAAAIRAEMDRAEAAEAAAAKARKKALRDAYQNKTESTESSVQTYSILDD